MKFFTRVAAALLALLTLLPFSAFAATTGNLIGVVTDGTGATLPGVTVTVTSPQLQGSRQAVTNEKGEYTISLLPPGTYRVEFVLGGFDTVIRDNVRVSLDTTTKIDAPLALGAVTEAITVTAEAVVIDPTQTTIQQNFGPQHLKYSTIGSNGRSYQSVLQQAPGVAGGNNPNVMGAHLGQNNYMLDGVNTTDPVTHTFGSNLPFDAIQEVSIQTLGKDAEYGRAIGGVVNVVTKSGGNDFSGTFDGRYTSDEFSETNEFYGEDQDYQEFKPSATLGGPILQDRLWFFGTLERVDNKTTDPPQTYGGENGFTVTPGTAAFEGWNSLLKLTATPAANHTLSLRVTDNRATVTNAQGNALYSPEADAIQDQDSQIYNLGYDAILTPSWLASAQVGVRKGYLETRPISGDLSAISQLNDTFGFSTNSYSNYQFGNRDRNELIASTTYFFQGAGSHTFKAGVNLDQAEFTSYNNFTGQGAFDSICTEEFGFTGPCGGFAHVRDRRAQGGSINQPFYAEVYQINPAETYNSDLSAFYVQDEWHPLTNVTARIGLRYETMDFEVPGDVENQPSFSKLQPRIGASWDIFNNTRSVVHGFWGQVMDDNGLALADFGSSQVSYVRLFLYNAATQSYDTDTGIFQGGTPNQFEAGLKPTVSNEAHLGFTQRIWTNTSLDVTGVWRESDNMFEDGCVDFDCHYFIMTNRPNGQDVLKSKYQGVIFKLESRPTSWLNGLISYTWSESKGSVEYTQNAGADFDVYPAHFVNRYGYLSDDSRHRIKASGFVRAPWGTTFGLDGFWQSGSPDDVTMSLGGANADDTDPYNYAGNPTAFYGTTYVIPRGERRLPDLHRLDFQALHEFNFGRVRMGLVGTVYNLLGSEIATNLASSIGPYAGCDGPLVDARSAKAGDCVANPLAGLVPGAAPGVAVTNTEFGDALEGQLPRRYEVGIRFEF